MPTLKPYLTFNGTCRDAMNFYKDCLGGELSLMPVGESPVANEMPPGYKDQILHASLKTNELEILASDMQPVTMVETNANHLCLICTTVEEAKILWEKLSAGGKINQPLHEMFFGFIGTFTDKFGKYWMIEADKK